MPFPLRLPQGCGVRVGTWAACLTALASSPALAGIDCVGFAEACDPKNGTIVTDTGSVNTEKVPESITLISDAIVNGKEPEIPQTSLSFDTSNFKEHPFFKITFNYFYSSSTPQSYLFGYSINDKFFQISNPKETEQKGTITFDVAFKDTFGFVQQSINPEKESSASTVISGLLVESSPVPIPGPLPVLGVAAAFSCSRKLRKRIASRRP